MVVKTFHQKPKNALPSAKAEVFETTLHAGASIGRSRFLLRKKTLKSLENITVSSF